MGRNLTRGSPDRLAKLFWLLGLAQAAHSMEEMAARLYDFFWIATGRLHSSVPSFPQFRMSAGTFAILNMGFIALLLGTVPSVEARRRWALAFACLAGAVELLNGAGHTAGAFIFGTYVPGLATAPFLFVLAFLLLRELVRAGMNRAS